MSNGADPRDGQMRAQSSQSGGPLTLCAYGDANDPREQSGWPFHLLEEGRRQGVVSGALPLTPTTSARYRAHRALWNARRLIAGHPPGGYVYSSAGQELQWAPVRGRCPETPLLRCYQLLAPSLLEDCAPRTWFYVDMTLRQLFGSWYEARPLGEVARAAVELETEGYRAALAVITFSHWAANSVVSDYGIDAGKVHVVLPGANLDPMSYQEWTCTEDRRRSLGVAGKQPLRFVFVGYDWRRKGLDRLLRGHALARRRGSTAILRVIGCERRSLPVDLRDITGVEWCGVIDKRTQAARYLSLVAECDVGCLLSRDEAAGIALREFGALGLAILGTTAGGALENTLAGASVIADVDDDDAAIADLLLRLAVDEDWRGSLRAFAWEHRRECSWTATVERLAAVVSGHPPSVPPR